MQNYSNVRAQANWIYKGFGRSCIRAARTYTDRRPTTPTNIYRRMTVTENVTKSKRKEDGIIQRALETAKIWGNWNYGCVLVSCFFFAAVSVYWHSKWECHLSDNIIAIILWAASECQRVWWYGVRAVHYAVWSEHNWNVRKTLARIMGFVCGTRFNYNNRTEKKIK